MNSRIILYAHPFPGPPFPRPRLPFRDPSPESNSMSSLQLHASAPPHVTRSIPRRHGGRLPLKGLRLLTGNCSEGIYAR